MLKKINRIVRNKEFDRVFKTGQSFYSKILGIKAAVNNLEHNRLGIIISTKISKKAVVRNRFKRQIREIIANDFDRIRPGKDIVVVVLPDIIEKEYEEIKEAITTGFKKLNLYR